MRRTLVVTNDFPPKEGGIESFVLALTQRLDPSATMVLTASRPGGREYDSSLPFPVVRIPAPIVLPEPTLVAAASATVQSFGAEAVWFGAAAPNALVAPALRRAGARRQVATAHGHEVWWARVPVTRQALRRIGSGTDVVTYLGEYTRSRIAAALRPEDAARMQRLTPGVDAQVFTPEAGGAALRSELGLHDRPVVVHVSRMVERKGQDVLLRALPLVQRRVPDAAVLLVGDGPARPGLERLVDSLGLRGSVRFTGRVPQDELPAHFGAGDVFCMPARSRHADLEVEGLGIVYLEASGCGLPVVAGDSGGAPDAVLEGETGFVVDGRSPEQVADRLIRLLGDAGLRERMGRRGREWVLAQWGWDDAAARLRAMLDG